MNKDYLPSQVTTDFSLGSAARLLNPFSGMIGQGKQYVPEWWIKLFSSGKDPSQSYYQANKGPGKVAHILAKISAGAVAFGGAAYLLRAFMHSLDIDNIESMKAGNRASKSLQTTEIRPVTPVIDAQQEVPMPKQKKKKAPAMQKQQSYAMALGALPPLTALAAMIAAFKLSDKTFDTALGRRLDKQLAQAQAQSQDLAINRIRKNRNLQEQPETIQKQAAFQGIQAAVGLLLATIAITGGVVGFNWHRANSPAVAKYKAYKKGLQTYNKRRSLQENIESSPLSDDLVKELDSKLDVNAKPTVQEQTMSELLV